MEYLSQECYDRLTQELNELVSVELPKARNELEERAPRATSAKTLSIMRPNGRTGRLLSRISYMQKTLRFARVMDTSRLDNDTVGLLRRVEITNLATNTTMAYTIVNPHEANVKEGKISIKSPIAEALLCRKVGDVVTAHVPCGVLRLRIEKITV